ncbi:MAG TPA: serine/threonine-protein kinase [Coleofasciculaceae cyanobacterium]
MNYCINPWCQKRENPDNAAIQTCQTCGTPLLVQNRYRLLQPLRELGGQEYTEIFEVTDAQEPATSKVMKILKSPELLEMFQREAQILQNLTLEPPNSETPLGIPSVEPDGYFTVIVGQKARELHCLVMEKIEGLDLEEWLKKNGPISENLALKWLKQLTLTLAYLHQKGLLHRDIKPSNIMRKLDEQLVLIDFGTVRETTDTYMAKIGRGRITSIVSPGYTPLEQIDGRAVPQSDFYALGRSFVYLLTGKHPIEFLDDDKDQLIWRDSAPQISDEFADLIDELIAPLRSGRPRDAGEILERLAHPHPSILRRTTERSPLLNRLVWLNTVLLFLELAVGGVLLWQISQQRLPPTPAIPSEVRESP